MATPTTFNQNTNSEISYSIYQVKNGDKYRDSRFAEYSDNYFKFENYKKVYDNTLVNKDKNYISILNTLYEKFNTVPPKNYRGRSLSLCVKIDVA